MFEEYQYSATVFARQQKQKKKTLNTPTHQELFWRCDRKKDIEYVGEEDTEELERHQ